MDKDFSDKLCIFEKLFNDPAISSKSLVDFLDKNFNYPSLIHSNLYQDVWIRDHKWNLGYENHRNVGDLEAVCDYKMNISDKFWIFYFVKYLKPFLTDETKYSKLSPDERLWIDSRMKGIQNLIADKKININELSPEKILEMEKI